MAKIGGRGCPRCGSHNTDGFQRSGVQRCGTCEFKWTPCERTCRGWKLSMRDVEGPCVIGCRNCGVPNRVARTWPEAYNALARELLSSGDKMEATVPWEPEGDGR
jgi:hypothetical protein